MKKLFAVVEAPRALNCFAFKRRISISQCPLLLAMLSAGALFTASPQALAALTYYTNRVAFDLANPGLPTETFEAGTIAPGTFALFTGPLNSSTANALFSPGSILPGLSIADNPGPNTDDLVYVGDGTHPGVSKAVLSRPFGDSTDLSFSAGVPSVGFDFGATIGPGVINFGSFTISLYGVSGLLDSEFVSTPEALSFFGVFSSTDLITRISVYDGAIHSELIDNVSFGTSVPVPEPGSITLFALALAVLTSRCLRARPDDRKRIAP